MTSKMFAVWLEDVGTEREDNFITFPTDRRGVEYLVERWSMYTGHQVVIEERGGYLEGYIKGHTPHDDAETVRVMVADPDPHAKLFRPNPRADEPGQHAGTYPMGITGRYMDQCERAGHPILAWNDDESEVAMGTAKVSRG